MPVLLRRSGGVYLNMPQQASGFAIVGVAVWLRIAQKGRCEDIGIGVTGLSEKPFRARPTEERLRGNKLTARLIEESASQVTEGSDPLEDLHASAKFRAHLARVYTSRAIQEAAKRAVSRHR
jgi:carbon-monoxide dehydrogenase medium subunit